MNVLGDIERNTGLRLPQDATTLLGSAAVISYGGLAGGFPNIAIRSQPASLAAADAVLARVRAIVARTAKLHLATKHSGSDLVVATTSAYADTIAAGGSLASVPSFTTAMGGMPSRVAGALYVDLSKILPLFDNGNADLNQLSAVGLWSAADNGGALVQLRLSFR
jgi:hypothetical protein